MSPTVFKLTRERLGLSQDELAAILGYTGENRYKTVSSFERGVRPVPMHVEKLVTAYREGYRPADWPATASGEAAA